jgi:hypothetical protein
MGTSRDWATQRHPCLTFEMNAFPSHEVMCRRWSSLAESKETGEGPKIEEASACGKGPRGDRRICVHGHCEHKGGGDRVWR